MDKLFLKPESSYAKKIIFILTSTVVFFIVIFYSMGTLHSKENTRAQQQALEKVLHDSNSYKVATLPHNATPLEKYKFNIHEINSKFYSDIFLFKHQVFTKKLVKYCSNNALNSRIAHTNCTNAEKVSSIGFFFGKGIAIVISELSPKAKVYIILGFIGFIILFKSIRLNYLIGTGLIFIISQLFL